ncbi:hypothetical protein PYW08_009488 [Mythimna loreyi]|uniref:Uncharacterized protein n=1 Tax=Mythimna loreyi TaxID=667449 RepID=A0ACC2Q6V5_9NEOP|nr:hypothetical protein PYW08_009488 [Mythimna loreyi]
MFAVIFCITCAVYWWWHRQRAKTTEPPTLPGSWPIVGHLPLLFFGGGCNIWNKINEMIVVCYDLGGVATAHLGPVTVYCVTDPDDCNTIASTCLDKDPIYDFSKPWLGESLFTAKYEIWKNDIKLLQPAFSPIILNTYMNVLNSQSRKLVEELEKYAGKGPFDHFSYLQHNALDITCLTTLGEGFTDTKLTSDYLDAVNSIIDTIIERIIKIWWHSPYTFAWSKLKKQQDAYLKILHKMSNAILQKRKSEIFGNRCLERNVTPGTKFKPFIDILLEQSVENGVFNDEQIRAHVDLVLAAGHESMPNVLLYATVLLGSHPEAQEKLFSEIQEVIGGDRDVEKLDLSRMQYLEAVLKESMRLYSVAPLMGRKLERDVKLKNYTLSSGQHCILLMHGLHLHPMWGSDRHEFKPERWLEPAKIPDNLNLFAPFGLGRRHCIGKTFSMMSMKTTLAHVIRRYRIKADHTKMRLKYVITLKPDNDGHFISIEDRT